MRGRERTLGPGGKGSLNPLLETVVSSHFAGGSQGKPRYKGRREGYEENAGKRKMKKCPVHVRKKRREGRQEFVQKKGANINRGERGSVKPYG